MGKSSMIYSGRKISTFDGKGNLIEETDTRVLEEEIKYKLEELDKVFTDSYHEKLGFSSKEKGDRKILEARMGWMDDKVAQDGLLLKDKEIKAEYAKRKEMIVNSKDCDACHDAIYASSK